MSIADNKAPITLPLKFHDGGSMNYTFVPGTLHYNKRTGIIVSFELRMGDGSMKHIGLVPRSKIYSIAAFLAPFGLQQAEGSTFRNIMSKNVFRSFGNFLLVAAASAAVVLYLKQIEAEHSSYYTLDDDHELCIKEPMYLRV